MTLLLPEASTRQALTDAFADVLSYPHESPAAAARRCAEIARTRDVEAGSLLESFAALVEAEPLGALQEAYTRAFDLDTMTRSEPTCYPYVGHYLFDESHKRGAFILELRKRFRAQGFEDSSGDLSDHLVVLLRFLAVCADETLADELVDDAILPALARIGSLRGSGTSNPGSLRDAYLEVLSALELSLGAGRPVRAETFDLETEREWARDSDSLGIDRDWCGH